MMLLQRMWLLSRRVIAHALLLFAFYFVLTPVALVRRVLVSQPERGWVRHNNGSPQEGGALLGFLRFLRQRKRYWLLPIVLVMCVLALLFVLSEGAAVAPFIYTLF